MAKNERKGEGLKVIGAGFGRTGTTSLCFALTKLGFPCYHMRAVVENQPHISLWINVEEKKEYKWDEIFEKYTATVDWPAAKYYKVFLIEFINKSKKKRKLKRRYVKELMEKYPEAKVLLSERDAEKWYKSCMDTIYLAAKLNAGFPFIIFARVLGHRFSLFQKMVDTIVWSGTFRSQFEDKEKAIKMFNDHNDEVKRVVPKEKLLVYSVQEGWSPLCEFLSVPVCYFDFFFLLFC